MKQEDTKSVSARQDLFVLCLIALPFVIFHTLTNGRYGFHRDELQVLDDARHMDWGFVAYPPFTPFIERVSMFIFGSSLAGLRFISVLTQGLVVVIGGLMARELGGKRLAQVIAALAVAISPLVMFEGTEFQYSSWDYLWWVLAAYFLIRLLKSENPRWWLAVGATFGIGLETKYAIVFFIAGLAGGLLLTSARRYLLSPWLWAGFGLALLIFLPNAIWQFRHDFISLDFLKHIHTRDVGEGRAAGFVKYQFLVCTSVVTVPLWLAGLAYYFFVPEGKRYRMLGWAYVITFAIYVVARGRFYYLAPAYPMLLAAGAVMQERWVASLSRGWSRTVRVTTFAAFAIGLAFSIAFTIPLFALDSPHNFTIKINEDLREEVGWTELVDSVAAVRDSLSPAERANFAVLAANYGEVGAVNLYGPAHGLPQVISGVNSVWYRGYGDPPPQTLIVLGLSDRFVNENFYSCRLAGHITNRYGIVNEESREHPNIFVCGPPKDGWVVWWKDFRYFG
ncbi:MAG TPA: glycosyltransferase family 39 protein [Candidatus Acidoferrales bacterium]|jgi:4-amino-4-deoxy-L-arabinose transferase-like glycosyltransferase|nr:glycosyltransferase family 39 protein [Candidatus Acidoferrales bacterium]